MAFFFARQKARVMELSKQGTDIVSMRGYSNELLMVLKEALNFTVDPVEFTVWGSDQGDNTWDGVIGALFRKVEVIKCFRKNIRI